MLVHKIEDCFTCSKIKQNSFLWQWNLNNCPADQVQRVLLMAALINQCHENNQTVRIKPDRRSRAKGLSVIFANELVDS